MVKEDGLSVLSMQHLRVRGLVVKVEVCYGVGTPHRLRAGPFGRSRHHSSATASSQEFGQVAFGTASKGGWHEVSIG